MIKSQITLVIATFNSADRVELVRDSLLGQRDEFGMPWGARLKVMCVDGGSTDSTCERARAAGWTVLDNPAGDPVSAKVLGWETAESDVVCFLDHDEVFLKADSLAKRMRILSSDPKLVAVFSSGYCIQGMKSADAYLSEYGDAFSCFAYRSRNNCATPRRLGRLQAEKRLVDAKIYPTPRVADRVLLEVAAQGVLVSKGRLARALGHGSPTAETLLQGAGLTNLVDSARVALANDDPVGHYPRASWSSIRAKSRWRLHNNLRSTGAAGASFRNREGRSITGWRSFCFVIHTVTLVPLLFRAMKISLRSRKNYFLGHTYLSLMILLDAIIAIVVQKQRRYGE